MKSRQCGPRLDSSTSSSTSGSCQASDVPKAFQEMERTGAQALIVQLSPFLSANRKAIVELAVRYRLPVMYSSRSFVDDGGLMSYGPDSADGFGRAANFVDKIFKGARPGDLPVEQPTIFELVVNLAAAKAIAVIVPQTLLLRANDVISLQGAAPEPDVTASPPADRRRVNLTTAAL